MPVGNIFESQWRATNMSLYDDNSEYYSTYSAREISFTDRRATQAEFDLYWSNREPSHQKVSASISEELKKMPSAKPAGANYYANLNGQLFDKFCRDVAQAMILKERHPELVTVGPAVI